MSLDGHSEDCGVPGVVCYQCELNDWDIFLRRMTLKIYKNPHHNYTITYHQDLDLLDMFRFGVAVGRIQDFLSREEAWQELNTMERVLGCKYEVPQ